MIDYPIHSHPEYERSEGVNSRHAIINRSQLLKAQKMENAMEDFISRVDNGEVRSIFTYKQFREILSLK